MGFLEVKSYLSKFRVGIAGAGGLGSNCSVALARCGIGTIVIVDFDKVEAPNLNRQYYFGDQVGMLKAFALKENIEKIGYGTRVVAIAERLNRGNITEIFYGCDVIVEALDSADMKEMLIETIQGELPGLPVIAGSGLAGWGNINEIHCRKIDDTLFVCGDERTEETSTSPVIAPRVGMVACMQADMVVELLMKRKS